MDENNYVLFRITSLVNHTTANYTFRYKQNFPNHYVF
jgi:hypothetical protein